MFWLLGCMVVGVMLLWRAPWLGFAVVLAGLAVFMGLALPYASGVVWAVIVGYTVLFASGAAVLLYQHLSPRLRRWQERRAV